MAKRNMARPNSNGYRNLKSAGMTAANATFRTADKAAVGLFRWAATDHTGFGDALTRMPSGIGFLASVKYTLEHFLISVFCALIGGVLMFVLIAFGIPFLITGHF